MTLCYTCDEQEAEREKYPVFYGYEGWGGRVLGYDCEECAERKWESYQDWLTS